MLVVSMTLPSKTCLNGAIRLGSFFARSLRAGGQRKVMDCEEFHRTVGASGEGGLIRVYRLYYPGENYYS